MSLLYLKTTKSPFFDLNNLRIILMSVSVASSDDDDNKGMSPSSVNGRRNDLKYYMNKFRIGVIKNQKSKFIILSW